MRSVVISVYGTGFSHLLVKSLGWIAVVVFAVLCFLLVVYWRAWIEVKQQPREKMFFCSKHGPISMKHTIQFAGVDYCPRCYNDRLVEAEKL